MPGLVFRKREVSRQNFNPAASAKTTQGTSSQRGLFITLPPLWMPETALSAGSASEQGQWSRNLSPSSGTAGSAPEGVPGGLPGGRPRWGSAVQQVRQETRRGATPSKILQLFSGFAPCPSPLSAFIGAPSAQNFSQSNRFEVFSSLCLPVCSLLFSRASANRRSFLVLTHG